MGIHGFRSLSCVFFFLAAKQSIRDFGFPKLRATQFVVAVFAFVLGSLAFGSVPKFANLWLQILVLGWRIEVSI